MESVSKHDTPSLKLQDSPPACNSANRWGARRSLVTHALRLHFNTRNLMWRSATVRSATGQPCNATPCKQKPNLLKLNEKSENSLFIEALYSDTPK